MKSEKLQEKLSREQAIKMGKEIARKLKEENELLVKLVDEFDLRLDVEWIQKNYTTKDLHKPK